LTTIDASLVARVELLEQRHKLLCDALRYILEDRFAGEMPHASADAVALLGGEQAAATAGFQPHLEDRFVQLETQRDHLTNATRYVVEGRWVGEMPHAAAEVVALMGGEEQATKAGFIPGDIDVRPPARTRGMLDRRDAPDLATAEAAALSIGADAWNVYIGGPFFQGTGWTPDFVRQLAERGFSFLPTYVGQQRSDNPDHPWHGILTAEQGSVDGQEAVALLSSYGWTPGNPVCLDVEADTFALEPNNTLAYVGAWAARVRAAGYRPGVYANPGPLAAMAALKDSQQQIDFVWVASWISHARDASLRINQIHSFDSSLWSDDGCRAWQYAGSFDDQECQVMGLSVDISITDVVAGRPN
jgi:Domain of unknown function (DUF1906)